MWVFAKDCPADALRAFAPYTLDGYAPWSPVPRSSWTARIRTRPERRAGPQHPDAQPVFGELIAPNQDLERQDIAARRPLGQKPVARCAHPRSPTVPDKPTVGDGQARAPRWGQLDALV